MDIKKAIAELIQKNPDGLSTNSLGVLQKAYQTHLRQYFPEYKTIDDMFAAMSKPIDRAKIIDEVARRGLGAIDEKIKPASFARALSAKNLPKSATGNPYASWKDLTPEQRKTMADLLGFARGRDTLASAGKYGGGSDTAQKLEYAKILEGAGLPSWLSGAASTKSGGITKVLETLYRDAAVNRSASVLSDLLADPVKFSAVLKNAPKKPESLLNLLKATTYPTLQASSSTQNR